MKDLKDLLQERLELIEAGRPLEECVEGLAQQDVELLKLAVSLREVKSPKRKSRLVSSQKRQAIDEASTIPEDHSEAPPRRWLVPAFAFSGLAAAILVCGVMATAAAGFFVLRRSAQSPDIAEGQSEVAASSQEVLESLDFEAPDPDRALLSKAKGLVELLSVDGSWNATQTGEVLKVGQRIRTGALSSAVLTFFDGSQARLGANTEISVDALDGGGQSGGSRVVQLTQWIGESDHEVVASDDPASQYQVRTPSGTGTAQGTSFRVLVTSTPLVRFSVDEGSVAVASLNITVVVVAGQSTTIEAGKEPDEPVFLVTGEGEVGFIGNTWRIANHPFLTNSRTVVIGDPEAGDWVAFEGRILSDGTRFADKIVLLRRIRTDHFSFAGTVESIGESEWAIAGQVVQIGPDTTIETGIEEGDFVRVGGAVRADGALLAKIIRLKEKADREFEFTGVVEAIEDGSWTISGVSIAVNESTEVADGLVAGDVVRVEGRVLASGDWLAEEIKRTSEVEDEFEFTGVVESVDPWIVSGIELETRPWTEIDSHIGVGSHVEVEGRVLADGTWLAEEIESLEREEEQPFRLVGEVSSIDPWVVGGTALLVDEETKLIGDIQAGDLIRVKGTILADGTWHAEQIKRVDRSRGCLSTTSAVRSLEQGRIVLLNWQRIEIDDDEIEVDGEFKIASVVIVQVCVDENGTITVATVTVIYQLEFLPEPRRPEHDDDDHDDDDDDDDHHHGHDDDDHDD